MKKKNFILVFMAVVSMLFTTACSKEDEKEPNIEVTFGTLVANGSTAEETTLLTLTFDKAVEGFTADNIALTAGTTGITKGALTNKGKGVYELAVSSITDAGEVSVAVAKEGYTFTPASQTVAVFAKPTIKNIALIKAIESAQKITFTKDTNGYVDVAANKSLIESVKDLTIPKGQVTSLEGIEYFKELTSLICKGNELGTLKINALPKLTWLFFNNCKLTSLTVSGSPDLTRLICVDNQLESLELSELPELYELDCHNNQLKSLDISQFTKLEVLFCESNKLTTLDVSKNTKLVALACQTNQLATLDVSKNSELYQLRCYDNRLSTLDVSMNTVIDDLVYSQYWQLGKQTSDGVTAQNLTLTCTTEQKALFEDEEIGWKADPENANITLKTK